MSLTFQEINEVLSGHVERLSVDDVVDTFSNVSTLRQQLVAFNLTYGYIDSEAGHFSLPALRAPHPNMKMRGIRLADFLHELDSTPQDNHSTSDSEDDDYGTASASQHFITSASFWGPFKWDIVKGGRLVNDYVARVFDARTVREKPDITYKSDEFCPIDLSIPAAKPAKNDGRAE